MLPLAQAFPSQKGKRGLCRVGQDVRAGDMQHADADLHNPYRQASVPNYDGLHTLWIFLGHQLLRPTPKQGPWSGVA
jgi:hypothetical protein